METSKKYSSNQKLDAVHEPASVYGTQNNATTIQSEELMHPILIKLLEKAKRESELGLGRPHEVVWAEMKLKHNFK